MGVASGCGEQEVGVASESGWNLWVWLLGVVLRRYIDFLILLIPTPLVSVLFCSSISTFCSFFKMFFVLSNVNWTGNEDRERDDIIDFLWLSHPSSLPCTPCPPSPSLPLSLSLSLSLPHCSSTLPHSSLPHPLLHPSLSLSLSMYSPLTPI